MALFKAISVSEAEKKKTKLPVGDSANNELETPHGELHRQISLEEAAGKNKKLDEVEASDDYRPEEIK